MRNFGPIVEGEFVRKNVNIFFGPNNSGKSMTARLIHGIISTRLTTSSLTSDFYGEYFRSASEFDENTRFGNIDDNYGLRILQMVGGGVRRVVSFGKKQCNITFQTTRGTMRLRVSDSGDILWDNQGKKIIRSELRSRERRKGRAKPSVYIPATRTGTTQLFSNIVLMRNNLLRDVVEIFGGVRSQERELSPTEISRFLQSFGRLPLYQEEFYSMMLESGTAEFTGELLELFRSLHGGSLEYRRGDLLRRTYYVDPSGARIALDWVGSGIVSSLPVLLGLLSVAAGGTLIIEEPEVNLEPKKQMTLIKELCEAARKRKISLIITTHSDFIVKRALAMVANNQLRNNELGLYYFDRSRQFTQVVPIDVDKTGEAETELFTKAVESLVGEYDRQDSN